MITRWSLLGAALLSASGLRAATLTLPWSAPGTFHTWQEDGLSYARATELFALLDGTVDLGPFPTDAVVNLRGRTLHLYYGSPFVRLDDQVFNLVGPVLPRDGGPAVPVATVAELVGEILGLAWSWDPQTQALRYHPAGGPIETIRAQLKRNGLIIDILTAAPVDYEVYLSMDDWLNIIIPGARVADLRFDRRRYSRYVWEFKTYQFAQSGQISFRLRPGRVRFEHRMASGPDRVEITLIDTTFAMDSAEGPGLLQPRSAQAGRGLETDPIDVVVVDAGHGGEDLGAVGPRGTREKDVVLGVALRLARLLDRDPSFRVILTREDDRFVPLRRRAEIANEANADLFISLHANSAPRKSARGFETFFLAAAKTDEARATAQLENASLRFEEHAAGVPGGDLDFILTDLLQNQFLVESAALAEIIQEELGRRIRAPDRGVNQAGFVVLYHAYMPSVLVETGFLSNVQEEAWLASDAAQERIAEALYESIVAFRDRFEEKP